MLTLHLIHAYAINRKFSISIVEIEKMANALLGSESNQYLMDWTAKQGRILTDSGNALQYYSQQNGYTYTKEELPHYYLEQGVTHLIFRKWAIEDSNRRRTTYSPIIGVWDRPLFAGKWEHTTNNDEIVYNIQTGTLFVDLRIPKCKPIKEWEKLKGRQTTDNSRKVLEMMSDEELRLYARQHVFGGYSMLTSTEDNNMRRLPLCTRHHCIDWNYIPGKPRPRPNKWYIEVCNNNPNVWKELSYATDEHGQSYYYERWERIDGDDLPLRLAMRKKKSDDKSIVPEASTPINTQDDSDGILVAVGVSGEMECIAINMPMLTSYAHTHL